MKGRKVQHPNAAQRLGTACRALRREREWTLEVLARKAKVDVSQLSKLERGVAGEKTGFDVWVDIARALGLTPGEFVRAAFPEMGDTTGCSTPT